MKKQTVKFRPCDNIDPKRFVLQQFNYSTRITQDDAVPSLKEILDRVSRGLPTGLSSGMSDFSDDDLDYTLMDKLDLADAKMAIDNQIALHEQSEANKETQEPDKQEQKSVDASASTETEQ